MPQRTRVSFLGVAHVAMADDHVEGLLDKIAQLQAQRDELIAANDTLVEAQHVLRAMTHQPTAGTGSGTSPADGALESKSRFARFVDEVTDKKDWKLEAQQLRTQLDALTASTDAALNASQLNVKLLQQTNRSLVEQKRSLQQPKNGAGAAATRSPDIRGTVDAAGQACCRCAVLEGKFRAAEEYAATLVAEAAEREAAYRVSLESLAHDKDVAEVRISELDMACGELRRALNEASHPPPANESEEDDADVDLDFDEFGETPKRALPSAEGSQQELLAVALSEVKAEKMRVAELQRKLKEAEAARMKAVATATESARVAFDDVKARADNAEERLEAALSERARLEERFLEQTAALEEARRNAADATTSFALDLKRKEAAVRQLQTTLTSMQSPRRGDSDLPDGLAISPVVPLRQWRVACQDQAVQVQFGSAGPSAPPVFSSASHVRTESAPTRLVPDTSPPKAAFARPTAASTSTTASASTGGKLGLKNLFLRARPNGAPTMAAAAGDADVQKLRKLLEDTLQENFLLAERVQALEAIRPPRG
jgi:hypothetical protein